jgi:hypothetical protein
MDITGISSIFDLGSKILERFVPDPAQKAAAALELFKAQQAGEFKEADIQLQLLTAQTDINKIEAANLNTFVSGWRPAIGWVCAMSLFTYYVPYCIVSTVIWAHQCWITNALVQRPDLGIADLLGLVAAMLGIAGMRTAEKFRGVAS